MSEYQKCLHCISSFFRLCDSKQSKVYLPEQPFPHAEVCYIQLKAAEIAP